MHCLVRASMLNTKVTRRYFAAFQDCVHLAIRNPSSTRRNILDNTASTQLMLPVLEHFVNSLFFYANIHRGQYDASQKTTADFERAYNIAANLVNARSWREIIFGRNTTEMLNLVARCMQEEFRDGDNVVISRLEHNSNYVTWYGMQQILKKRKHPVKITIRIVDFDKETGELDMAQLRKYIDKKTKVVSVTGASNFMGARPDIKAIGIIAHCSGYLQPNGIKGSYFVVDGAQLVPGAYADVQDIGCDFLAWSFHKMCLPLGVGALYARSEIMDTFPPFLYGGDMIDQVEEGKVTYKELPWKYTAGTPNILGTVAAGYGMACVINLGLGNLCFKKKGSSKVAIHRMQQLLVELLMNTRRGDFPVKYGIARKHQVQWRTYLRRHPRILAMLVDDAKRVQATRSMVRKAMDNIRRHEEELAQYALDEMEKIPNVTIYGPHDATKRAALIAFNIQGMKPHDTARALNRYHVEARSGTHCACLAHAYMGIIKDRDDGSVRISFAPYNSLHDAKKAVDAIRRIAKGRNKK